MTTVIWIDWYAYHISRFRALFEHQRLGKRVVGIELVGGCGVHAGFQFRNSDRAGLPIVSLFPQADWNRTGQLKLAWAVWRKLNELRPSSVLTPGWYTMPALTAAAWAKIHGKRSILMSETTEEDHRRVWWKELLKRLLLRLLFDSAIAGGKPHVRYLSRLGFAAEKIATCYDVVDNNFYQEAAERARSHPGVERNPALQGDYFLYVGRLAPEKNIAGCLRAFAQYRQQGGRWSLVLVGDGPLRAELEKQCDNLKIREYVVFAGLKSASEITLYYAFAGCFVLPSVREPWGLVVNEAMASGLPVLVSNRCGCVEDLVKPGENGYLFDPSQEATLPPCMLEISSLDPTIRREMGRRSQEIVANYSLSHWAGEIARLVCGGNELGRENSNY